VRRQPVFLRAVRPADPGVERIGAVLDADPENDDDQGVSPSDPVAARDHRLLMLSVWASVGFAVLSSVWGVLSGSSMIVFDGLYSFVSVGLSLLAVMALRTVRRGPDENYPWGREVWEPLVVVVKALALAALCVYAVIGGVSDLLSGGREVATGWALVYGAVSVAGGVAVTLLLRRDPGSDLVRAEAAEWLGDTLLSVGVLVGFALATALVATGHRDLAAYVDPAMVVLVSVAFLHVPARLVAGGLREILSMAPPADVQTELQACVDAVRERFGLQESFLRASKVGARVDVEVDFVVGAGSAVRTVADCDVVRQDLHDRLAVLGHGRSVIVAFTTDRKWAQ
jgi:cation diffusion facilitator family transporter